jgi:hypothetical protein
VAAIVAKLILAGAMALAGWLSLRILNRLDLPNPTFDRSAWLALAATRLGLFVFVFLVLRFEGQSDVTVYYGEARAVLAGSVPIVDFATAYGPLFDYAAATLVTLWDSPKALIFASVAIELIAFPLWLRLARRAFDERETRVATVLYVFNPLPLVTVVLGGQNHVWLSALLAAALLALGNGRDALSGIWLGLSIVLVKFLSLLFAPVLFLAATQRLRWALAFLAPCVAGYGVVIALGGDPLAQVAFHGGYGSSGNLPYLLSLFGLDSTSVPNRAIVNGLGLAALCGSFLVILARCGPPSGAHASTILLSAVPLVVTLIVSRKSFTTYLVIALFPVCLAVARHHARRSWLAFFYALMTLAAIEPSLWFRWLGEGDLGLLWAAALPAGVDRVNVAVFAVLETMLVAGYVVILWLLWTRLVEHSGRQEHPDDPAAARRQCSGP